MSEKEKVCIVTGVGPDKGTGAASTGSVRPGGGGGAVEGLRR